MTFGQYLADRLMPGLGSSTPLVDESELIREDVELAPALSTRGVRLTARENSLSWPFVSIILPVRSRARILSETLDGLAQQTYPSDRYEVVAIIESADDD